MGINTKGFAKKKSKKIVANPKEKLVLDLRSCMNCKFFYGNNIQCVKNKKCSGGMKNDEKVALEPNKSSKCNGCPYGKGKNYCFPCIKELLGKHSKE